MLGKKEGTSALKIIWFLKIDIAYLSKIHSPVLRHALGFNVGILRLNYWTVLWEGHARGLSYIASVLEIY